MSRLSVQARTGAAGRAFCKYLFRIYPGNMSSRGPGAGRPGLPPRDRRVRREFRPFWRPGRLDRRRGDDQMDVRMKVEPARVRVQHRDRARRALQLPVVPTAGAHRFPSAAHQRVEDPSGATGRARASFSRPREGQQEIVGRNKPLDLSFRPWLILVVLTVRTKAMAAGMRDQALMIAVAAANEPASSDWPGGGTAHDRRQCPERVEAQPIAQHRYEFGLEGGDDLSQADHRGAPWTRVSRSISRLIRSLA